LLKTARRKLGSLNAAMTLDEVRSPPGDWRESLSGDWAGQRSIRLNDQFRICFIWRDSNAEAGEITGYH
jgi:proteic killer suppression protein